MSFKPFISLGILLFLVSFGKSQSIDTLNYVFIDTIKDLKVNKLNYPQQYLLSATRLMYYKQYDSSIVRTTKFISWFDSTKINSHPFIADAYEIMGNCFIQLGNIPKALNIFRKSLTYRLSFFGEKHKKTVDSYNNIGVAFSYLGKLDSSYIYTRKSHEILIEIFGEQHKEVARSYSNLGSTLYQKGKFIEALEMHKKALTIKKKEFGKDHFSLGSTYSNLGLVNLKLGRIILSIDYFQRAEQIFIAFQGNEHPNVARIYQSLGYAFSALGDEDKSLNYHMESLRILLKTTANNNPIVAQQYQSISECFLEKKDGLKALEYQFKGLELLLSISSNGEFYQDQIAEAFSDIGVIYEFLDSLELAKAYYLKSLKIEQKVKGPKHPDIAITYFNLGILDFKFSAYDQAVEKIDQAIRIRKFISGPHHPDIGLYYFHKGNILTEQKNFKEALIMLDSSLLILGYQPNYDQKSLGPNYSKKISLILNSKCIVLNELFKKTRDYRYLDESKKLIKESISHIEYQSINYSFENSILDLIENSHPVFNQAMETYSFEEMKISDHESLFNAMERNKSLVLRKAINEVKASSSSIIPQKILEKEKEIRLQVSSLEINTSNVLNSGFKETDSTLLYINEKLFQARKELDAIKNVFKTDYPKYFDLRYNLEVTSIKEIQKSLLTKDQTMISYFIGSNFIYAYAINNDGFIFRKIKKDFPLEETVSNILEGLTAFHTQNNQALTKFRPLIQKYTKSSFQLYKKLIEPLIASLKKEIIIIQDGVLRYLPFEVLLTKIPEEINRFHQYDYLLKEYTISYNYSASLYSKITNLKNSKPNIHGILAVAPFYLKDKKKIVYKGLNSSFPDKRDTLNTLEFSAQEVSEIVNLIGGRSTTLIGKEASIKNLKEMAKKYNLLHISTHSFADDRIGEYAFLALISSSDSLFYNKLYIKDIYNMELKSEMVVLSSCESAKGKLRSGEGLMSVARAFTFAGSRSVVTSLWQVDQQSTNYLMERFYYYLNEGFSKSQSLRQSKLDFLHNDEFKGLNAYPFYWAAFIGIGDMRPIKDE